MQSHRTFFLPVLVERFSPQLFSCSVTLLDQLIHRVPLPFQVSFKLFNFFSLLLQEIVVLALFYRLSSLLLHLTNAHEGF